MTSTTAYLLSYLSALILGAALGIWWIDERQQHLQRHRDEARYHRMSKAYEDYVREVEEPWHTVEDETDQALP